MNLLFIHGLLSVLLAPSSSQDTAGYDRKALQSLTEYRQLHRKTVDGRLCAAAFVQDEQTYTDCTEARNPEGVSGREWCYVEVQLLGKGARDWDYCQGVINYEDVRVAFRDMAKQKTTERTQVAAFFQEQDHRLLSALRKYQQICVASSASEERMQAVYEILNNSKRAMSELQQNISKIKTLQAIAAQVAEDTERDAEAAGHNKYNCGAVRGYEDEPTADGLRATYYNNAYFGGPPFGYRDEDRIDLKAEGLSAFPGLSVNAFSVRYEGFLVPSVSNKYHLFTYADCGVRVFLDDAPVIVDRMKNPEEGDVFNYNPIPPLHPAGFTGVAKVFSTPQELKAGHRHRLRVEYFHLSSHKYKNPNSARLALGWTSNVIAEQLIPSENFFQSDSPPLLKIAALPGEFYNTAILEDGEYAFTDSLNHFIADVPAYYRGLRLLRTTQRPKENTIRFEISAECVLFIAMQTNKAPSPPSSSKKFVFQPLKFATVDNAISVYTALSREGTATEQEKYNLYAARALPGMVAFDVPEDVSFFGFLEPLRTKSIHLCKGNSAVVSSPRSPAYESCTQSSAVSPQHDCKAGLSGINLDIPFASWRTAAGRAADEYLLITFKVPVEIAEVQFKTLDDPATWPTEISIEFPGQHDISRFPVRPGDHTYQIQPPKLVRGATLRITGKRTLDTSAGTGGCVAFIGVPCAETKEKEKETAKENISIFFGEMTSEFIPAGFKQDEGSIKSQRGAFAFGWDHRAPLVHFSDCENKKEIKNKMNKTIKGGVSFPEPNCSPADRCSPAIDCDFPNSWSIDMPSLGRYFVTVEVGSPCAEEQKMNLYVNEILFIKDELLNAGQYSKAVGQVELLSSPTIRLTSTTRVTLQSIIIQKIKTKNHKKEELQQQQQQQQQQQ